ncbi:uncharacterized protein A4U43_C02F9530 [Asparagus officinalis]|uniref:Uncharacterized protein n=1 Tax=Asparagus officinalis TaxID=4686 RepID=A0A5P1FHW6_ASPOF|nr:uncharacterized protein A4U43_C02F9530 [Asparagus officinalis]
MTPKRINSDRTKDTSSTRRCSPDADAMIADLLRKASSVSTVTDAKVADVAVKSDDEIVQYGCPSVDVVFGSYLGEASAVAVAVPSDPEAIDRIARGYVEKKRPEDSRYGEGTTKDRKLKDLRWEREILQTLRARVAGDCEHDLSFSFVLASHILFSFIYSVYKS